MIRTLVAGTIAGGFASVWEFWILPKYLRRFPLWLTIAVRGAVYGLAGVLGIVAALRYVSLGQAGVSPRDLVRMARADGTLQMGDLPMLALAMTGVGFLITGFIELRRVVGPGQMMPMLAGRYLRPREERRIFMFLDLEGSTAIAERLGPFRFAELRTDLFNDLAEPVLDSRGQIVQYVGDEAVISWRFDKGGADGRCIRCYYDFVGRLNENAGHYRARYDVSPRFRAGVHGGSVVVSEVGDIKREISFSGDTMNTAARVQSLAKELGERLLVSAEVMRALDLPESYRATPRGQHNLRGREAPITVVSVDSYSDHEMSAGTGTVR